MRGRNPASGDLARDFACARLFESPALEEGLVLGAEPSRAVGADPVGELQSPSAPGRHALHERIAVVARVPRAAGNEHRNLPTFLAQRHTATDMPRLIRVAARGLAMQDAERARKMSPLSHAASASVGKSVPDTGAITL